ncbi:MAG: lactate permease LctP family transporter [Candidatus Solibacter usitatus]|nr:lactate permease LctP family transporter [Candidatus Solibacter usitatus]
MIWTQNYDPLHNAWLSTALAATPVLLLFYLLAVKKILAHLAAVYAFVVAILLAAFVFGMPVPMVAGAVAHGLVYAVIRIAWTLLCAVWVYELTVETGHFEVIKESIGGITADRRLQVLLIAFAFGAVLEGAGGGGAPVAIAGAMMVGLGFQPFAAAVLCLIANTSPVAFGGVGNPVRTLVAVTGLGDAELSATIGRILPWTALILPFWLVRSMTSWANTLAVWPGLLVCGGVFAAIQFYWSNFRDSALVDIIGGMATLVALALFFKVWKPVETWRYPDEPDPTATARSHTPAQILHAWSPFLLLSLLVILWGTPAVKNLLDRTTYSLPVPGLHQLVQRVAPVVSKPHLEPAAFDLAWLSAIGTATFLAGLISGPILGLSLKGTLSIFLRTCHRMRFSMAAILAMLGLGFVTRYSGMDAVMGLAMTHTGALFPFFGTMLGWLGVALTGTDAGSNALFGSLQVITANRLGLSPVLMAAANSAGGVMGKMIDAQSIIVACAAVGETGREGDLFRAVLRHSILLAAIVGLIVSVYAYLGQDWIPSGRTWGQ